MSGMYNCTLARIVQGVVSQVLLAVTEKLRYRACVYEFTYETHVYFYLYFVEIKQPGVETAALR